MHVRTEGDDQTSAPTVTVNESAKELTLTDGEASYPLNYTVAPTDATVAITCDQETGFTREGNDVTFTAAATYVFTVTATNDAGEASGTITVTVSDGSSPSTPDAPQITINEPTAEVNLEGGEAEYTLDYSVTPADAAVSITCNRTTGFTREGNDVTFTAAATYTFTIVATSEGGTAKGTIRVTVNEEVLAPEFTTEQANVSLELTTAQFPSTSAVTLDYAVTGGGEMAMSLAETTEIGGWTYDADADTITFTKAGTYTFTLTATNEKDSDTSTFTATVTDQFAGVNRQDAFLDADFTSTQIPSGWTELKGANGSITYSENGAKFDVASTSDNNAIVRTPFTVNEGLVEISVTFSNDYSREGGQGDVPFLNLIVLESADTNTVSTWPVGIGVQDSYLVVHEGTDKGSGGWNSGSMSIGSSQRVRLIDNEVYTVKAIIDFDNERVYLYISGENRYDDDRATEIPLGDNVYLGNFDFRGNGNDPAMFRFGTNAVDTQATLYSVTACRLGAEAPVINVENTTANVQLSGGTASYKLDYSVTPADAEVTVTCDNQSADIGADKKTVTFDTAGTYVFTITAVNDEITRTAKITVTVLAEDVVSPVITVNTAEKDDLYLTGDSVEYALDYTVTPDTAAVTVTCDQQSGAVIDSDNKTVTFTAAGVYTFTITAVNDNVTETETIVVTVTEKPAFTAAPEDGSLTLQTVEWDHKNDPTSRPSYAVSYEVSGTESVVLTETTDIGGWWFDEANNVIYFTKGGSYEFKLTASNAAGSAEETFNVEVADLYEEGNWNESVIWEQQFNTESKPDGWTYTNDGTGVTWTQDGVSFANGANDKEFVDYAFAEEMTGLVEFDVDFTISEQVWADKEAGKYNSYWANIFFINDKSSGSKTTISVAIVDNQIWINQGNDAGGWQDFSAFESQKMRVVPGEKYTLRAVLDTDTQRMYLYLLGENRIADGVDGNPGETVSFGGSAYLGNFDFRDNTGKILMYRMGSDNGSAYFTMHSIVAKQLTEKGEEPQPEAPTVTVNEENGEVTLSGGTASYTLNYSVDPADATVSIACNQESGFEITENKTVKFNAAGTYVFTITASKDGSTSTPQTITVVVNAEAVLQAPTFTTPQEDDSLTLQTAIWTSAGATTERPHIQLAYEVSDPEANVTLEETTSIGGWTYDAEAGVIYFTRGGSYEFKLTASNSEGSADCTFAVDVTDLYAESGTASAPVIFDQQFNAETKPDGWTETIGTPGTDSITYSGNGVTLHKDTSGKSAFLQYDFDEQMTGVIEFTVDFKTTSTGFVNLFFLRGNGNKYAVTVAVQNNILMVNENDKSWSNNINLLNNTKTRLVPGVDYTLRAVVDCENERVYLYISGESLIADGEGDTVGETVAMGDNLYLGNFDFRANGQPVLAYRMGSDIQKAESDFTVYSITAKQLSPVITVNESAKTVDYTNADGATYTLNYSVSEFGSPKAAVITCDQETGWTNEGNVITFTQTGTYVFTVTAENAYGSGSGTITVTVKKPTTGVTIDVDSDRDAAVNAGGYYTLKYTAGSDVTDVDLTCDKADGYSYDAETGLILFTNPGVYKFTLTAKNTDGSLSDTSEFTVTVTDEENVLWNPTLTSEVSGPDITNKADGADKRGTITFDENGMTVTSGSGVGSSAPLIFYKKFDSALSGLVKTEITFVDNNGTGFINLAFFHNSGITSNDGNEGTMVVAVNGGLLQYYKKVDNKTWTSFSMDGNAIKVQKDLEYTLTIYNDFDNEMSYFYLTGTVQLGDGTKELDNCFIGSCDFRRKGDTVEYFYTGTSQKGVSYTIKSLNIEQSFAPQIVMNDAYKLQPGGTLALNTLGAADGYIIDCEQEGWSIEGNVITFAQAGNYTITARAYNTRGTSEPVTITVSVANYGAWLEEDGLVVINTIAAAEQSAYATYGNGNVGEGAWTPWSGYGLTGMQNADNGTDWPDAAAAKANAPWLEFKVKIQTPGTYYILVQVTSFSGVNNSVHSECDGTTFQNGGPAKFCIGKWVYTDGDTNKFELTAGEHTIRVYPREDGCIPNQIVLRMLGEDETKANMTGLSDSISLTESDREIIAE